LISCPSETRMLTTVPVSTPSANRGSLISMRRIAAG
jgi:hypothetical protein